jgi:hypothetical protein
MQNIALTVLNFYWEMNFANEDLCELDWSSEMVARIRQDIETRYSAEEKAAIRSAAAFNLARIKEQEKESAKRPAIFSTNELSFLEAIAEGSFSGE